MATVAQALQGGESVTKRCKLCEKIVSLNFEGIQEMDYDVALFHYEGQHVCGKPEEAKALLDKGEHVLVRTRSEKDPDEELG